MLKCQFEPDWKRNLFKSRARPCLLLLLSLCSHVAFPSPEILQYKLLETKAHNPNSFTQGLVVDKDHLIESSGLYRKSFVTRYHKQTGKLIKSKTFPGFVFLEGLTIFDNKIVMLSWKSGKGFILDKHSFKLIKTFPYSGEGWGITHNQNHLITSDGSSRITFREPNSFAPIKAINVRLAEKPQNYINELEFAQKLIWANVWMRDEILAIDPNSGSVLGVVNLEEIAREHHDQINNQQAVLNGIAFDSETGAFWITGKYWPKRYLLEIKGPRPEEEGKTIGQQQTK